MRRMTTKAQGPQNGQRTQSHDQRATGSTAKSLRIMNTMPITSKQSIQPDSAELSIFASPCFPFKPRTHQLTSNHTQLMLLRVSLYEKPLFLSSSAIALRSCRSVLSYPGDSVSTLKEKLLPPRPAVALTYLSIWSIAYLKRKEQCPSFALESEILRASSAVIIVFFLKSWLIETL